MTADTKIIAQRGHATHLPTLKPTHEHSIRVKHTVAQPCKRHGSTVLPRISRSTSSASSTNNVYPGSSITTSASENDTASRVLRSHLPQPSQESSSAHIIHNTHSKRSARYAHIQSKINTGLARTHSSHPTEPDKHQCESLRPIKWIELKHRIEHDLHLRAHTKRMEFHHSASYATQLATLGNLVRSKVKSYVLFATGNSEHRYKIVVHLTVFPNTAVGLHVASRCLWNTDTDNSITIKMQGVDCDILIIIFLCYTDIATTST